MSLAAISRWCRRAARRRRGSRQLLGARDVGGAQLVHRRHAHRSAARCAPSTAAFASNETGSPPARVARTQRAVGGGRHDLARRRADRADHSVSMPASRSVVRTAGRADWRRACPRRDPGSRARLRREGRPRRRVSARWQALPARRPARALGRFGARPEIATPTPPRRRQRGSTDPDTDSGRRVRESAGATGISGARSAPPAVTPSRSRATRRHGILARTTDTGTMRPRPPSTRFERQSPSHAASFGSSSDDAEPNAARRRGEARAMEMLSHQSKRRVFGMAHWIVGPNDAEKSHRKSSCGASAALAAFRGDSASSTWTLSAHRERVAALAPCTLGPASGSQRRRFARRARRAAADDALPGAR